MRLPGRVKLCDRKLELASEALRQQAWITQFFYAATHHPARKAFTRRRYHLLLSLALLKFKFNGHRLQDVKGLNGHVVFVIVAILLCKLKDKQ